MGGGFGGKDNIAGRVFVEPCFAMVSIYWFVVSCLGGLEFDGIGTATGREDIYLYQRHHGGWRQSDFMRVWLFWILHGEHGVFLC